MEAAEERPRDAGGLPLGKRIPLNSRKLTAPHLRQIAKAMDLPTERPADELRQQIEGSLASQEDREISTVQVIMKNQPLIETQLWLVDSQGVVLQTEPVQKTGGEGTVEYLQGQLAEELDAAKQEIGKLKQARVADQQMITELRGALESSKTPELAAEVSQLQKALQAEKQRAKEWWRWNCEHIAEQDMLISTKDDEIAELKHQLATRPITPSHPWFEI